MTTPFPTSIDTKTETPEMRAPAKSLYSTSLMTN
jgi:hypothetical protein